MSPPVNTEKLQQLERQIEYLSKTKFPARISTKADAKTMKELLDAKEERARILEKSRVSKLVSEYIQPQWFECHLCCKKVAIPSLHELFDRSFMSSSEKAVGNTMKMGFSLLYCCGESICMDCFADYFKNGCSTCGRKYPSGDLETHKAACKLAEEGNAWAQFQVGCQLMDKGKRADNSCDQKRFEDEAVAWYRQAASQDVGAAATMLARLMDGSSPSKTITKDPEESLRFYEISAGFGDPYALCMLGTNCESGASIPKDEVAAVKWYTLAVHQGQTIAAFRLGKFFREGTGGLEISLETAKQYFELAAKDGMEGAQYELSRLLFELESDLLDIPGYCCIPRCLYWARKSRDNGFVGASKVIDYMEQTEKERCFNCLSSRTASCGGCCKRCKAFWYCSRACQIEHWKDGHNLDCFSG